MPTSRAITSLIGALTILMAGCEFQSEGGVSPIDPTKLPSGVQISPILLGTWTSSPSGLTAGSPASFPTAESCAGLAWTITEQNGSTYTGTFEATCAGGITLTGTATGTLTGTVLSVSASGTATLPGATPCAFTLTGTANLVNTEIHVTYSGNSCLGPISGAEVLSRS